MNISLNVDVLVKDGTLVLANQDGNILTFSSEQSVQRKVSMITMGELCNLPKINVAQIILRCLRGGSPWSAGRSVAKKDGAAEHP